MQNENEKINLNNEPTAENAEKNEESPPLETDDEEIAETSDKISGESGANEEKRENGKKERKKLTIHSEFAYILSILLLSFSVAMTAAADFGVSMIVAPAYMLSMKIDGLSFGVSEYIIQGALFIVFCIMMRKVKLVYFSSFVTCLIYGLVLDGWRLIVPVLNPSVTEPGSMDLWLRILFLVLGMVLTSLSIAIIFRIYLYPQVYDFFVKGVSEKFGLKRHIFKIIFDFSCLAISIALTFIFFGHLKGIGIGTLVMTALNGIIIGLFDKLLARFFDFKPLFPRFAKRFEIL